MPDIFAHLQRQAAARPAARALIQVRPQGGPVVTTYAELAALARGYAAWFAREAGAARVIPLLLGKSADCVAAMFGAGRAFACLNRKLRGPQVDQVLDATDPTLAVSDGPGLMAFAGSVDPASATARTRWRVLADQTLLAPHRAALEKLKKVADTATFESHVWSEPTPRPFAAPTTDAPTRPGCCLFTSGSTGRPKGVLIAAADLYARAQAEVEWYGLTPADVLLNILPFSFDVGLNQLLSAVLSGATLVMSDSWLPTDLLRQAAEFGVTGVSSVPAIWNDVMGAGLAFDTAPGGRHAALRYITVSGGDMPHNRLEALPAMAPGAGVFKTYGQTETFRSGCLRPDQFAAKTRSVGRAFGTARVYTVRDDRSACAPGEEGEIVHAGLGCMLGYLGGQQDAEKIRPNPFHGVDGDPNPTAVFTGDNGYLDADGFLFVCGRRDGMLKIAGNRVYPREIADQILALPGVLEAEVVGVKSADGDTHVYAFIVPAPGAGPAATLRRDVAARLPSYMVPRELIEIDAMPRTASGKPDRPALADRAAALFRTAAAVRAPASRPA